MKNQFKYNRKEREKRKKKLRVEEENLKELAEDLSQAVFEREKTEIKDIEKQINESISKLKNI